MQYKGDEQPSLNNAEQPHSIEHMAVPASLLPSVLSRLGLEDMTSVSSIGVDKQLAASKVEEISVRVAAVRSLEEQRERHAIESLLAALHDSAWEVRAAAVWALGKFGEQAPLEALMKATDDEDGSVRAAALRTLGLIGDRAPRELLIRALDDPNWQVREIATLTLGELDQQEQPRTVLEVETGAKIPSYGDSPLTLFTAYVRALHSRVVRDLTGSLIDTRSTIAHEVVTDGVVNQPNEMRSRPQQVQTKSRRLMHIAEGVLAALIIAGLVASWLIIEQRLHPSQGSAYTPLLVYHGHVAGPAVWSSDSKYVSFITDSTSSGETVLVWNSATGQVTKHMLHALRAKPLENKTVFAPDGKYLAFVERDASNKVAVQVWDVVAWRSIFTAYFSTLFGYFDLYWLPDSTRIFIPAEDGTMQVWNVVKGRELVACHVPPAHYLPAVSYLSHDGQHVQFGEGQESKYVLDLTTCKLLIFPSADSDFTVWSPQGDRFATHSLTDANMVQVWDAHTGRNLASFHLSARVSDMGLVWTPDGTRLVTSGDEVNVLDVAAQRIILKVIPNKIVLLPVWALSSDGERLASLSGADTVQIWDAVTGRKLNTFQSPGNTVKVVAWSPDSSTLATGSTDGTVRVWHANTAPETYRSGSSAVLNIAWSPDGKSIATGDVDGNIWVWQVRYSGR
jgi:WD40 repeat protein